MNRNLPDNAILTSRLLRLLLYLYTWGIKFDGRSHESLAKLCDKYILMGSIIAR
jgi:hypothetical protein